MKILVDFDGTLVGSQGDALWEATGYNREEYSSRLMDDIPVREDVVKIVRNLHAQGHELILWTNRFDENREVTMANLSKHGLDSLFSGYIFGNARKKDLVDGADLVIDNLPSNRVPGVGFLKV